MVKRKMLFITTKNPFDKTEARSNVIGNYLKGLSAIYDIYLVHVAKSSLDANYEDTAICEYIHIKAPDQIKIMSNLIRLSILCATLPLQNCLYYSEYIEARLGKLIRRYEPDIVFCEMIRTTTALVKLRKQQNIKYVCDMADMLSIRYEQQYRRSRGISNPFGQLAVTKSNRARHLPFSTFISKFILGVEYYLCKKYETKIPKVFDTVTLVSIHEIGILRKRTGRNNIYWVPNGTNVPDHRSVLCVDRIVTLSFLGVMNVPHNEEAALYIIDKLYPELLRQMDRPFQVLIIGKNPSERLRKLARRTKHIKVLGYVQDLETIMRKTDIFISPLRSGSGVKTKLFEAMKYRIPIVATRISTLGLVVDEEVLVEENTPERFVNAIVELTKNDELRFKLTEKAHKYVKKYYDWPKVTEKLLSVMEY